MTTNYTLVFHNGNMFTAFRPKQNGSSIAINIGLNSLFKYGNLDTGYCKKG